ncbi:MAG: TetR/AcrR family transcriptional regulator [Actinomycetota bacterium]
MTAEIGSDNKIDIDNIGQPCWDTDVAHYHHGDLRAALLARASEVIAESGIEKMSLRSLARDLGVSHGAPRNHFADRDELVAALATEGCRRATEVMQSAATTAGEFPLGRLRAQATAYIRLAIDEPALFRAMNHPEVWRDPAPEMTAALAEWMQAVRINAEVAHRQGWNAHLSTDAAATAAVAAIVGAADVLSHNSWLQELGANDASSMIEPVIAGLFPEAPGDDRPTDRRTP